MREKVTPGKAYVRCIPLCPGAACDVLHARLQTPKRCDYGTVRLYLYFMGILETYFDRQTDIW